MKPLSDVFCGGEKKVSATPVKFTHEWEAASSTHKSRTTADHNSEMTITQNRECDLL